MNTAPHPFLLSPHRGFFLLGIAGFILIMGWWLLAQLVVTATPLPAGWIHTWLMVFGVFTPFASGFLFTAYPRWLGAPGPAVITWLAALVLQAAGTLMFISGTALAEGLLSWGAGAWLLSIALILFDLLRARRSGKGAWLHSLCMIMVFLAGFLSLCLLLGSLRMERPVLGAASASIAFWSYLLCIFLVVAHRMIPFFTGCVLKPYTAYRPAGLLIALLLLANAQAVLRITGMPQWQGLTLLPMALICAWLLWRWQFWRARRPRLLLALFLSWAALLLGLALGAIQGLVMLSGGSWWAFRAPEHLLGIAFSGAMVLAMTTRVTLGHSGRPLKMGSLAWAAFLALMLCGGMRAWAEVSRHREVFILGSATLWLIAGTLWAARFAPMLVLPRTDGKPG